MKVTALAAVFHPELSRTIARLHNRASIPPHCHVYQHTAGPKDKLNSTVVSQPAIYVASMAALEKLKEDRPEVVESCNVAAGLSLGEYTALVFAGAMTFEDGLKLVLLFAF